MNTGLSCRALKSLLVYFRQQYGTARLEAAIAAAGLGEVVTERYLLDENNWVSFEQGQRLIDALSSASGDDRFARLAGRLTPTPEVLGASYLVLKAFGTPAFCYRRTLEVSRIYNRVGDFSLQELHRTRAIFTYRSHVKEPNRRFCELRVGQFESFPTVWKLPLAQMRELTCQVRGDACCTYELKWVNPHRGLVVLGLALGFAALALLLGPRLPGGALGHLLMGGLVGALVGSLFEARVQARERNRLVDEQTEGSLRYIDALSLRFEEIQQLNRTLEAKVEERTRELEKALARQVELDQLKTQFFTNLNHDLRSPLTVVTGALSSLLVSAPLQKASQQRFLEMALRSATRLEAMIGDMLELARIDAGVPKLDLARVNLTELVDEIVQVTQPYASTRGLTLRGVQRGEPVWVDADAGKLERVVMNLVINACKFSPPGAVVEAWVEATAESALVHVRDEGVGIPLDAQARIFERFARGSDEQQRAVKGSGIGLAVVKEFVRLHGGEVSVTSAPGEGSTFSVRLPRAALHGPGRARPERMGAPLALLVPETVPPLRSPPGDGAPVLIIEDNEEVLAYLRAELSSAFSLVAVVTGEEALEVVKDRRPRLVLSDVMLPGMSGFDVCRALRRVAETGELPILLFSAKGDVQTRLDAFTAGADDFIPKPFHPSELKARIEALLRRASVPSKRSC